AVMTNVVMLNFCYDVPVKLYASQLLCIAVVIAAPQLHRVIRAILGYAVPETPPRVRSSPRRERARMILKLAVLALLVHGEYKQVTQSLSSFPAPSGLEGIWKVEHWTSDGRDEQPRWRKLIVTIYGLQVVTDAGEREWVSATVVPAAQVFVATPSS